MLQENGFSKNYSIIESFLDVQYNLLAALRQNQLLHFKIYVFVSKGKEKILFFQLLEFLLVSRAAFNIKSAVVDCTVNLLRHEFAEYRCNHSLRQANIRSAQREHSCQVFWDLSLCVFYPIIHSDFLDFGQFAKALIFFHLNPLNATIAIFSILGSHISDGNCIIVANVESNCLLGCFYIAKYFVKERMFRCLIKSERDCSVTECVEAVTDLSGVDEIGVCDQQVISLSVDKQSQQNEFKKVVESAGILGNERYVFGFLDLSSDNCG